MKFGLYIDTSNRKQNVLYVYAPGQTENNQEDKITKSYTVKATEYSDETTLISSGEKIAKIYMYYKFPVLSADKSSITGYIYKKTALYSTTAIPQNTTDYDVTDVLEAVSETLPDPDINYVTITTTTTTKTTTLNDRYTRLLKNIVGLKTDNSKTNALLNGGKWTIYSVDEETNEEVSKESDETIAIGCTAYKRLSIEESFKIEDETFTLGDWETGYTINGKGNVITYSKGTGTGSLIHENNGAVNNLGIVNGKIAEVNNNSIKIAFETSDGTNYDLYDASGTHTEAPMSGDLAYNRARPYFGVTINADGTFGTLDKKTAANTVYKAEWTDARTKNTTTFYTNATATDLSYNPAKGKANTFTYVLDNDLNVTAAFTAKNVVVKGICKNAELTDNVAEGDNGYIYIPTAFKAENLSYNRNFSSSTLATVCLPFEVSEATFKAAGVTKTMQFYEVEAATNTYWFKYQDGSMRANEPYILKFNEDFAGGAIFSNLTNINVAATGNIDRFAVAPERPGSGADFLGVFVSTNATQLAQGGYTLYGFGGGKFRPMTISESNKCLPFRTYVRSRNTGNAPAEVFNLGELDEDGNVVSDGGETAISKTEAEAFSVKGINGALVITTDKAQRVSIYTLSGSLVKATNVEVGTVTVPVAAGMYIVNGKKVIVK